MGFFSKSYRVYSFRNDAKAVRKNKIGQRIIRKAALKRVGRMFR